MAHGYPDASAPPLPAPVGMGDMNYEVVHDESGCVAKVNVSDSPMGPYALEFTRDRQGRVKRVVWRSGGTGIMRKTF